MNNFPKSETKINGPKKLRYVSPVLVRYGQVRDLTQNGGGSKTESTYTFGKIKICEWNRKEKSCTSDRHAKEHIVRIGDHPLGIGLYLFDYKPEFRDENGHGRQFGVMAQEVEAVMPEAVCVHPDGYKMVDYGMLGIHRADQ